MKKQGFKGLSQGRMLIIGCVMLGIVFGIIGLSYAGVFGGGGDADTEPVTLTGEGHYENLTVGDTYQLSGYLVDDEGNVVSDVQHLELVPEEASGDFEMSFEVDEDTANRNDIDFAVDIESDTASDAAQGETSQ